MAKLLKLRRGSTSAHASFTGAEGEVTIDTTKDTAVVHDAQNAGGRPLAREDMSNVSSANIAGQLGTDSIATTKIAAGALPTDVTIATNNISDGAVSNGKITDGAINNAKVNATAAIAGTKISPDFGSQNIVTTGSIAANNIDANAGLDISIASGTTSAMFGSNSQVNGIQNLPSAAGVPFVVGQDTGSLRSAAFAGNVDVGSGLDVTGDITVTGTVDGRDVAADGTKLDGIESGATGDQTNAEISSALSDQRPSMKGAIFTDDGMTDTPVVKVRTDDSSPWAVQIANDSYWNDNSNGLKIYQDGSGNVDTRVTGNGAFLNWYLKTQNGGVSDTAIHIDTNRAVKLNYQGNEKLATSSIGVTVTGEVVSSGTNTINTSSDQKLILEGSNDPYIRFREGTTNKAYIQWEDGGYLQLVNEETGEYLRLGNGGNGLTWTHGGTESTVWHSGNDGSSSGLDADTCDGQHLGTSNDVAFQTLDLNGSINQSGAGAIYGRNHAYDTVELRGYGAEMMIGSAHQELHINYRSCNSGGTNQTPQDWYWRNGQSSGWSNHNFGNVNVNGALVATGNVTAYSDARLKTNVNTINEALGIVGKLRGVSFDWKESGKHSIGVIAQEVEEVLPEIVETIQENIGTKEEPEYREVKTVDYGKMVGVLINAINELKAEVDELKGGK